MIRSLNIKDSKEIHEINSEQLGYNYSLKNTTKKLNKLLSDNHHFLIGFEDSISKEIVGYLHAEVYDTTYNNTAFNILALAISRKNTRKGIGKKLMQHLELEAKSRGYSFIRFNSGSERENAHSFYDHLGYKKIKTQVKFQKDL